MAVTKSVVEVIDWTALPADTIRGAGSVGSAITASLGLSIRAGLMITVGHADSNANALGVEVTVEVQYGSSDEDWRDLYVLRLGAGTATVESFNDASVGASDTTFTTTGTSMSTQGEKWLILDATIENTESVRQRSIAGNVVTIVDALTLPHSDGLNITNELTEKYIPIPDDVTDIRVLFKNDDADAEMIARVDLSKMTAAA